MASTIRVSALIEATTATGPARNVVEFARRASTPGERASRPQDFVRLEMPFRDGDAIGVRSPGEAAGETPALPAGVETRFISYSRNLQDSRNDFVRLVQENGLEIDVLRERFRFDPRITKALRRAVRLQDPDIIQTHNVKSHLLVALMGLARSRPWIAFHHGYTTTDLKMRLYNQLDRRSLRYPTRVVTVSEAFARVLERRGVPADRLRVVHNSIDVARFDDVAVETVEGLRRELDIASGERMVLSVGRLSREKGHADLVRAFARLRSDNPRLNARLVLVGDGPERRRLEQLASSLGVRERLTFAGHVSDADPYYRAADLFVLPSLSEGSPNALLEAMAARAPIVACAVGGVPEIVTHDTSALLVESGDGVAMATAMMSVLTDASLGRALAARARSKVEHSHSPEVRVEQLLDIYNEVATGSQKPRPGGRSAIVGMRG